MKDLTENNVKKGPSSYLRFLRFVEKVTKKKFLLKVLLYSSLFFLIFFPSFTGDLIGSWLDKLVSAFSNALK